MIEKWEKLTNKITEDFIRHYFEIDKKENIYFDWVSVGGVFSFADYWFDFNTVLDCFKHNIKKEDLFLWYDESLKNKSLDLTLLQFVTSPEERGLAEEKYLHELKERVKTAQKELEQVIENYDTKNIKYELDKTNK
jgi:hypothetical protein